MKIIKVNGKDLSIPESWSETNLSQWVRLARLGDREFITVDELNIEILSILSKDEEQELISEIPVLVFEELMDSTLSLFKTDAIGEDIDAVNIDGIDYAFVKDFNTLGIGAKSTISMLVTKSAKIDPTGIEAMIDALTVLLRPARKITDGETGETYWELEKLDVKNLGFRRQLFLDRLSPIQVINKLNFFLSGILLSMNNTAISLKVEE